MNLIRIRKAIINLDNVTNIAVGDAYVSLFLLPGDADSVFMFEGADAEALRWWFDRLGDIDDVPRQHADYLLRQKQRAELEGARIAHEALCQQGTHVYDYNHRCIWCGHYDATAPVDPELAGAD